MEADEPVSCSRCGWSGPDVFPFPTSESAPLCVVCMGLVINDDSVKRT